MNQRHEPQRPDESRPAAEASLARARVLIAGVGGLGAPAAWALAAAGVGTLILVDPDVVEVSNLHRQILHRTSSVGIAKVESARQRIARRWPRVHVETVRERVRHDSAAALFAGTDFIVDGTDDAETKYVINDVAVRAGVAYSHAGAAGLLGQTLTVVPGRSACLRCVFPQPPAATETARCRDEGILGPVAGAIGFVQAAEALRYLLGRELACEGRLLTFDARALRWRAVPLTRDAGCPSCRVHPSLTPSPERAAVSHGS